MAEGIVYLDVDDEITSAAARIRSSIGPRVVLVVPYGSRIATSRMNFRLLSREALMSNRRLSIVSGDAAVRSLGASAGLPVFGSVNEYEATLGDEADSGVAAAGVAADGGDGRSPAQRPQQATRDAPTPDDTPADRPGDTPDAGPFGGAGSMGAAGAAGAAGGAGAAVAGSATAGAITLADSETVVMPTPLPAPPDPPPPTRPLTTTGTGRTTAADFAAPDTDDDPGLPPILGGRIRARVVVALALVALALVVAGVGAYLFLPSATIALTPRVDPIGPIELTVAADPTATSVDPLGNVVPAVRLDVPVKAARTFTTTGTHVEESAAHGTVTFTNYDTSSGVSIQSGSTVSTEGGVRFRTTQTAVLQPASILPFAPSTDSVPVVAARPGEPGNVPANTIRIVPQGQNPDLLKVNNRADTAGGTHTETPEVTQAEVDTALAGLQKDLQTAFDEAVAAGAGAPAGTKLFATTADLGAVTPDVDPATIVGQAVATFDLGLTAKGSVIAVDPSPIQAIARSALTARVTADHRLLDDSVVIQVGDGSVGEDGQITFEASASARQVAIVDAGALRALVKGKTAAEAKAVLVPFGSAVVTLWPDWAANVTGVDARLDISIVTGATGGSLPSASPGQRPSLAPERSPGSASPSGARSPGPSAAPSAP